MMKFPIHPAGYDRLKKLNLLPSYVIRDVFIDELQENKDAIVVNLVNEQILINQKKEHSMDEEAKRVIKHLVINELTDNLGVAVRDLEHLVDKVEGSGKSREEAKKAEVLGDASLSIFLDKYPQRLEQLNERVTLATNRLKELLF